jgi:putative nucleotidyltransferase with HDIG domain
VKAKKTLHTAIILAGLFSLGFSFVVSWLTPSGFTSAINDLSCQYSYLIPRKSVGSQKIVAAAIDDYSLRTIQSRYPFKRSVYADAITHASELGASMVVFDVVFNAPSDDPQEDQLLAQAIALSRAAVVLAAGIDVKKAELMSPGEEISKGAQLGLISSPQDSDGKIRRLRSFITLGSQIHYSLAVQTVAVLTRQDPARIVTRLPLFRDKTFLIDFTIKSGDGRVKEISFCDLLEQPQQLQDRYGHDFLKGALLVIYPEAQIIHDYFTTPIGAMPGGFLHINGISSLLRHDLPRQNNVLPFVFCLAAFAVLAFACATTGFLNAAALGVGVVFAGFWLQVMLRLNQVVIDLAPLIIFDVLFLSSFFTWKYVYFFARLLQIKSKATLDPVKGVFTSRYFFYRLDLERDNVRFGTACQLFLLRINGLESAVKTMDVDSQKELWQKIRDVVSLKKSFWSSFSSEELAGCVVLSSRRAEQELTALQCSVSALLKETGIMATVMVGMAEFRKDYQPREMLFLLFNELKSSERDVTVFGLDILKKAIATSFSQKREESRFLESLGEDIDEKNRQLLELIANLTKEYAKSKEVFFQVIASLVNALEARDPYTKGHSQHVCNYAAALAAKLGWSNEEIEKLRKAALLHDLGKVGIPDGILHKKDKLTDGEFEFIKQHEIISVKILEPIRELKEILPWILHHHERWNGQGYPHGLAGEAIPMGAQVLALADVFDALVTGRDYKKAFSFEEAVAELERGKGTHFNPEYCDIFISLLHETRGKVTE